MNKKIDKKFIDDIADLVSRYKMELINDGVSEKEARAIIASTFEFLGQNAEKLRK